MIIPYSLDSYNYFKKFKADIDQGPILDYGSNWGLFLETAQEKFDQRLYTGIDVDLEAIIYGRTKFPHASFIHYNAYNHMYNPMGKKNLSLPITKKFKTIISYSVFTHTTQEDFLTRVEELYQFLDNDGQMLISYCDVEHSYTTNFFYKKRIKDFGTCDRFDTQKNVTYLVDNEILDQPKDNKLLLTLYRTDYLAKILSKYKVSFEKSSDLKTFQSCIIIKK